jgi:UDP-N-acetylglucosamine transferase subunit ALG13
LLDQARDLVSHESRCWVTVPGVRADTLRAEGERVYTLPPMDQTNLDARNLRRSLGLVRMLRPRIVLTSGAGVVLAFTAAARALGAKILFAETMARVSSPSATGRIINRFASSRLVQWPDLEPRYVDPHVCRPTLLPRFVPSPVDGRSGTFISVGTHPQPFTRLLNMIDEAVRRDLLPRPIVAQIGNARLHGEGIDVRPWLDRRAFQQHLASAQVVVGHCGAGFLGAAISVGQRPIVLPRLASAGEHVDDHQIQLFDKLAELELIVPLRDGISAADVSDAGVDMGGRAVFPDGLEVRTVLAGELSRLTA